MIAARTLTWAAMVAAAAAGGWFARAPAAPKVAVVTASVPAEPAARPAASQRPLIVVASDGQVTLRVEQQPLAWVLEQIAAQSAQHQPQAMKVAAAAAADPAMAVADTGADDPAAACPTRPPIDPASLLHRIEQGQGDDAADALLRARSDGLAVPETLLRTLVGSAPTDRVRLAALDTWVEHRAGDPHAVRAALEAALLVPNAAVQQDARQRLADLDETERLDTPTAPGVHSP